MAKVKYIFDPGSLRYIAVDVTLKDKTKKFLPFLLAGTLMGGFIYLLMAFGPYSTPREKIQAQQLNSMQVNQKILDDRINEANTTITHLAALDDSLYRTMLGENALNGSIRQAGIGGSNKYEYLEGTETPENIIASFKKLDELVAKINVQEGSYKELFKKSLVNIDRLQHLPAIIPVANWDLKRIGSGFSLRRYHPILKRYRAHEGIDLIANTGTDIYASADGTVKTVRYSDSFGKMVEVDHGFGLLTLYAHMSKQEVKIGDVVKRGQIIGKVGSTGLSGGPHLHYEVHVKNKEVDPVKYFFSDLTPEEYKAVVAQSQSIENTME